MIAQDAIKHRRPFIYVNQVGGNDELLFDGHSIGFDRGGPPDSPRRGIRGRHRHDRHPGRTSSAAAARPCRRVRAVAESDDERAYRALVLGVGDYTRKCGFSDVVIGLSGGVDSAVTAAIAAAALGPAHVLGVAMPSRYSSPHSVTDAAALAGSLGIEYAVLPIDGVFQAYLTALAPVIRGTAART